MVERIRTEPDPYEPYRISQAIRAADLIFHNLQRVLEAGGSEPTGSSR